jgi:HEAT repeat protein
MKTLIVATAVLVLAACASAPSEEDRAIEVLERAAYLMNQHNAAHVGRDAQAVQVIEDDLGRLAKKHLALLSGAAVSKDPERRVPAVFALGFSGSKEAVGPLVGAAEAPEAELRIHAVVALGTLGVPEVPLEPIRKLLVAEEPELRTAALFAVRRLSGAGREAPLLEDVHRCFADRVPGVRNEAVIAAGRMGRKESVAALLAGPVKDPEPLVRQNAALALGLVGKPARAATPVLVELLRDEHTRVVEEAWRALNAIHEKDFDRSYATWRDWYEEELRHIYTCNEHREVIQQEPGDCPVCRKKLERVLREGSRRSGDWIASLYGCTAHPEVLTTAPARCGKAGCGKDLVPRKPDPASYACPDHPEVMTSTPARCGKPGCGKDLQVPVKKP